jgi:hypothetical protein
MAVGIRTADGRRNLSGFLLKPDFGVFERTRVRAYDVALERGSLRENCCRKNARTNENDPGNNASRRHGQTLVRFRHGTMPAHAKPLANLSEPAVPRTATSLMNTPLQTKTSVAPLKKPSSHASAKGLSVQSAPRIPTRKCWKP